jgi:hypothetical protein
MSSAGFSHRRLTLNDLQYQRALASRDPAFDLVVHQCAQVYLPLD